MGSSSSRVAGGGGEEAVLVHEPVGALAAAVAEDERPLGADGALAPRRHDELLLPVGPPHAGAGDPAGPAAPTPAPRRRHVEEEPLLVGVACEIPSDPRWECKCQAQSRTCGRGRGAGSNPRGG